MISNGRMQFNKILNHFKLLNNGLHISSNAHKSKTTNLKPLRSVLFSPGSNERAMIKAKEIPADAVAFDLEDAVAFDTKEKARVKVTRIVNEGGFGNKTIAVRINGIDTPFFEDDLKEISKLENLNAIILPKCEKKEDLVLVDDILNSFNVSLDVSIWGMIETPIGVMNLEKIAASNIQRFDVIAMGTSDLTKDLQALHLPDRTPLLYALSKCVTAARAYGLRVLDGVYLDIHDLDGFEKIAHQGKAMGFDGKTLIHPKTVALTNSIFGPSEKDIDFATRVITAWNNAKDKGEGLAIVDGQLIENLHVDEAKRILHLSKKIKKM